MYTFEIAYHTCQNDPLFAFVRHPNGAIDPINGDEHPFGDSVLHLVPGSFNPIHDGHRAIYQRAAEIAGPTAHVCYEMSTDRANKGTIESKIMEGRATQFNDEGPLIVSKHPLFYDKTGVLAAVRDIHIHIGIDTALRIVSMHSTVGTQGIRALFHVYPRRMNDKLWTINDLPGQLPINFVPEEPLNDALIGLSSTEIRKEMGIAEVGMTTQ